MKNTNDQFKVALTKMLPDKIRAERAIPSGIHLYWGNGNVMVFETEFLHLCQLARKKLEKPFRTVLSADAT